MGVPMLQCRLFYTHYMYVTSLYTLLSALLKVHVLYICVALRTCTNLHVPSKHVELTA